MHPILLVVFASLIYSAFSGGSSSKTKEVKDENRDSGPFGDYYDVVGQNIKREVPRSHIPDEEDWEQDEEPVPVEKLCKKGESHEIQQN